MMEVKLWWYIQMYAPDNLMNYLWRTAVQISRTVHFSECWIRGLFDRYNKSVRRLLMHYFDAFMNVFKCRFDTYILFHDSDSVHIFARVSLFYNGTLCLFSVGTLSLLTILHYTQIERSFFILSSKSHLPIFAHDATAVLSRHVQNV